MDRDASAAPGALENSSHEYLRRLAGEACARRPRPLREDVPARRLERVERRQAASREERDGAAEPAADQLAEIVAAAQEPPRARSLELEQLPQLRRGPVERRVAELLAILPRQVDTAELEVAGHVLEEVHELEAGADVVRGGDRALVVEASQHAEHEPSARI